MTILAVDIGRFVGISVGRAGVRPTLLSRELPVSNGKIAVGFNGFIRSLILEHNPRKLAWERPFVDTRRFDAQGEIRTQRLYGQAFALEGFAEEYRLAFWCERPQTIRKRIIGAGNAKEDAIMAFVHRAGMKPSNHHEADAYVVWRAASAMGSP